MEVQSDILISEYDKSIQEH